MKARAEILSGRHLMRTGLALVVVAALPACIGEKSAGKPSGVSDGVQQLTPQQITDAEAVRVMDEDETDDWLTPASGAGDAGSVPSNIGQRRFYFGVGVVWAEHWGSSLTVNRKAWNRANLDKVVEAGGTATNPNIAWAAIEQSRDNYNWDYTDHQVLEAEKRGLEMFAYTGYTPNWALPASAFTHCSDGGTPDRAPGWRFPPAETPEMVGRFSAFFTRLASRYCGRVKFYEFWNEPNGCSWMSCSCGGQTDAEKAKYAKWLRRWYTAMKFGCADTVLAVGGLDCNWGMDATAPLVRCNSFLESLYANDAGNSFDAVALHPYGYDGDLRYALDSGKTLNSAEIAAVGNTLDNHNQPKKRLWLSEWGFKTEDEDLKKDLVRATLTKLLGREYGKKVWMARYLAVTDTSNGDRWGLADSSPDSLTVTPRGSWHAFRNMAIGKKTSRLGPENPGMEFQGQPPSPEYTNPIPSWGPNGGWQLHLTHWRRGSKPLGRKMGYYSAGLREVVAQALQATFAAYQTYCFYGAAQGGADDISIVPYEIGYYDSTGAFVTLVSKSVGIGGKWATNGVCYTTGQTGNELGRSIVVRFGTGGTGDVWFDNLIVTATKLQ